MVGNLNFNGTLITLKYAFDPIELGHTRHIDLSKALIQRPIHHFTPQMVLHINPFLPILGIIERPKALPESISASVTQPAE